MNKIFINIGLPRASSTNLQKNILSQLNKFNYIGRFCQNENQNLYKKIIDYVENRKVIIKNTSDFNNLKYQFKNFCEASKKNILFSDESLTCPYMTNNVTGKHLTFSHWEKLRRLNNIIKSVNLESKYFFVHRNPQEGIPSLFTTIHHRIINIFGWEFRNFDYFIKNILDNNKNFKELKLLLDVYSKNKIKAFFSKEINKEIHALNFHLLKTDQKEFLKNLCTVLEIENEMIFENYLSIKLHPGDKNEIGQHIVYAFHSGKIYKILLKIFEIIKLKTFTKKLFILFGFTGFKKEMITIEINQNLLNQAITLNEQTKDF